MHLPDSFLSLPISAATLVATAAYGGYAHSRVRAHLTHDHAAIPLIGCAAGFIFAAQMLNFPVLAGASGHFLGAAFSTFLFGPFVTFFVMTSVLLIQALFFADGGLLALGANILLMGIAAPWGTYLACRMLRRITPNQSLRFVLAGCFSVVSAAVVCVMLLALSGTFHPLNWRFVGLMVGVHLLIGVGEGLITAAALAFLSRARLSLPEFYVVNHAKFR